MPQNPSPLPDFTRWPSFPFEGDMRVKNLADPVEVEPPRSGEDAADCVACNTPDDAYIWVSERWRVRGMDRPTGLPAVLILECRSHLDIGDLPNLLAAELGVMTVRLERAIRSLDGVARVHVNRWGDGSAHLHMWFLARPYGRLQLRGTFLSLWDDLLPVIPEEQWQENLAMVAAWLADFGGRAIAEPAHIQWESPSTFSTDPITDLRPAAAAHQPDPAPDFESASPEPASTEPSDLMNTNAETRDLSAYATRFAADPNPSTPTTLNEATAPVAPTPEVTALSSAPTDPQAAATPAGSSAIADDEATTTDSIEVPEPQTATVGGGTGTGPEATDPSIAEAETASADEKIRNGRAASAHSVAKPADSAPSTGNAGQPAAVDGLQADRPDHTGTDQAADETAAAPSPSSPEQAGGDAGEAAASSAGGSPDQDPSGTGSAHEPPASDISAANATEQPSPEEPDDGDADPVRNEHQPTKTMKIPSQYRPTSQGVGEGAGDGGSYYGGNKDGDHDGDGEILHASGGEGSGESNAYRDGNDAGGDTYRNGNDGGDGDSDLPRASDDDGDVYRHANDDVDIYRPSNDDDDIYRDGIDDGDSAVDGDGNGEIYRDNNGSTSIDGNDDGDVYRDANDEGEIYRDGDDIYHDGDDDGDGDIYRDGNDDDGSVDNGDHQDPARETRRATVTATDEVR